MSIYVEILQSLFLVTRRLLALTEHWSRVLEEETYQIPKWLRLQSVPGATFSCFLRAIRTLQLVVLAWDTKRVGFTRGTGIILNIFPPKIL